MKIQEIVNKPGMYKSKQLKKGIAVNVTSKGIVNLIAYKSIDVIFPAEMPLPVYKDLFAIEFEECKTREELF